MMMIAMMRSTPSGIVTFKDLYVSLKERRAICNKRSSFFTLRLNHKNNHKNNDDTEYALLT